MLKRIGVLTSGGDSPGMNAAVRAVVRTALSRKPHLEVFGIKRGYQGLIEDDILELNSRSVSGIINRGGTILLTARSKEFLTAEGRKRAYEVLKRHDIAGLVLIGGDGTFTGGQVLNQEYGVKVVGIPGSIDNDIVGTDFSLGFDTAVNTAVEAIDKIRDTATSHQRLFLVEVMGRTCGYIALYVGICGGAEGILIPETPTDIDAICKRLEEGRRKGKVSSILVIAEGDDAGNAITIAEKIKTCIGYETKVSIIGHQQRGGSPTAFDRVLATLLGEKAVSLLCEDKFTGAVMVGLEKNEVVAHPLKDVVGKKKEIDKEIIRIADLMGK